MAEDEFFGLGKALDVISSLLMENSSENEYILFMSILNELHSLMVKYRFRPSRKMGQHFMVKESVLAQMVELAELGSADTVLEIGAGTGFLTRELQKHCSVVAVELDERLCMLLENELPKENLQLVKGDFLAVELPSFNKVVSLPPYSKSSAIMFRLFQCPFELAVLVFQREFAERLLALPGFVEYNALSVLAQYRFDVKMQQRVQASAFFPTPEGDSCIVKMVKTERHGKVLDEAAFTVFIKSIFRYQNKNLRNALVHSFPFIKKEMRLNEAKFKEKIAGLQMQEVKVNLISVKEFVQIFNELVK